jgi:hypothetical protein
MGGAYFHSPTTPSWRGAQGEHRDIIKTYGEVEIELHAFLTLVLDEMGGQIHNPASFNAREEPPVPIRHEAEWIPSLVLT